MPISCPTYATDRQRRDWTPQERSDLNRRIKFWERIQNHAAQTPRAQAAKAQAEIDRLDAISRWERLTTRVVSLSPERNRGLQDFVASLFGQNSRALGIDPSTGYSVAGNVRSNLTEARAAVEGLINNAGRITSIKRIDYFVNTFKRTSRRLRLSRREIERLMDDTITVGQLPRTINNTTYYRTQILGNQTPLDMIARRRYNDYIRRMQDAGFSRQETTNLINLAVGVTQAFDEVRTIANALGVDVGKQADIGYFTRIFTRDARLRLLDTKAEEVLSFIRSGTDSISSVFARSRQSNFLIPEDIALASHFIDLPVPEIMNLLNDPIQWTRYLHNNLSVDQIDMLVDAGILGKLPMTSTELMEYFVRQYDMPFRNLSDMFVLDPSRVLNEYATSLQNAAGNSAMIRKMVSGETRRAGWAISRVTFEQNPVFRNFVPLGDSLNQWARQARISPQQLAANMGIQEDVLKKLGDTYVHPVVAAQWKALMQISMDPALMGNFARIMYTVSRWMTRTALTTPQFIFRNTLGGIISAAAAGANMVMHVPSMFDISRVLSQGFEDFDNTRPFRVIDGQTLTQRQTLEMFMSRRGQSMVPGAVDMRMSGQGLHRAFEHLLNSPQAIYQSLAELINYTMAHGDPVNGRTIPLYERFGRFSRKSLDLIGAFSEEAFAPFALMNNFFDIAFKWSTFQSVTRVAQGGAGMRVGQFITSGQLRVFDNSEDAFRHLDEYFPNPFNVGTATAFLNNYVMPFRTWAMANPPMQIRHAMRNPHLYLTYHRVRNIFNAPLSDDDNPDNPPYGGYPSYILEDYPIFIGRDDNGNPIMMMPNNYDPISDAFTYLNQQGMQVQRLFGRRVGSDSQLREQARGETFQTFLDDIVSQLHAPWRVAAEQLMSRDAFTGRSLNVSEASEYPTYFGVRVHPRLRNILEKIPLSYQLEQLVASTGVLGTAARYDVNGNLIDPGELSINATTRTSSDRKRYDLEDQNFVYTLLRLSGLNIRVIEPERGMQMTFNDVGRTITQLEESINTNIQDLQTARVNGEVQDPREDERRMNEIREQVYMWGQLKIDQARILTWMRANNVLPPRAIDEINRLNIQIRNLPYPAQEELDQIIQEALEYHGQLRQNPSSN